ncbi:MAG: GNAT family N-acetyltransferase [Clostridia bacterium]|nr:GNAT family N-acetyltransferase [Clostridia bacterium]
MEFYSIKQYDSEYCEQTAKLFYDTVHTVNAKDYSSQQLNVWANGKTDLEKWNKSLLEHYSLVAIKDKQLVGFGDIDETGYLDRLFVHKDFQRQGIASAICDLLECNCSGKTITTYSSITARPFFEKRGFKVIRENQVERNGIFLTNYFMQKA